MWWDHLIDEGQGGEHSMPRLVPESWFVNGGEAVTRDQPLRRVWDQGSRATFSPPPNGASASGWRSRRQRTEEGRN